MDREILFRGRTESGEWVEGDLHQIDGHCFIRVDEGFQSVSIKLVDPATVGQFTGWKDFQFKKIFEGDVLSVSKWMNPLEHDHNDVVRWNTEKLQWDGIYPALNGWQRIEILGNIHDTPELMEVKN
jgi:uncharacterized phage protein (TIGR01671 family)